MFTSHSISFSTVISNNFIFGIMEVWGFQYPNQPHISFAVLARHSQAQKCLQINPKPLQQVVMNF